MKIQISGLSAGIHRYTFTTRPADVGLGTEFQSTLAVDATLEKTATRIYLQAGIKAEAQFQCDRCVDFFSLSMSPSCSLVYVTEGTEPEGLDPSEVQIIPPEVAVIDLTEDVRQTIVLAVPLKLVCREDCRGLCPQCGRNLNTGTCDCVEQLPDDRWDKLRLLRENRS